MYTSHTNLRIITIPYIRDTSNRVKLTGVLKTLKRLKLHIIITGEKSNIFAIYIMPISSEDQKIS